MTIKKSETPNILADAFIDLLKRKPFEQVTVKDIVKKCDTTRTTFYRYFKDKYDLMNWIYYRHADELKKGLSHKENVIGINIYFKKYLDYFINVIDFHGQNSFQDFLFGYVLEASIDFISNNYGADKLTDDVILSLRMYIAGMVDLTIEWLHSGCERSIEEQSRIAYENIPNPLAKLLV